MVAAENRKTKEMADEKVGKVKRLLFSYGLW